MLFFASRTAGVPSRVTENRALLSASTASARIAAVGDGQQAAQPPGHDVLGDGRPGQGAEFGEGGVGVGQAQPASFGEQYRAQVAELLEGVGDAWCVVLGGVGGAVAVRGDEFGFDQGSSRVLAVSTPPRRL